MNSKLLSFCAPQMVLTVFVLLGCVTTANAEANSNKDQQPEKDVSAPTFEQWDTVTLNFIGPPTSENNKENPFLKYRLTVEFSNGEQQYSIRGYYAADGNAAASGANAGNVWQAKFTPPEVGNWRYRARLETGDNIAISQAPGIAVPIENAHGQFEVYPNKKERPDFRALGRLSVKDSYFYFPATDKYWLKVGANSPENFLGYYAIDGTYRIEQQSREGEASTDKQLHRFAAHQRDWHEGDPSFRDNEGKSIFGAINYLANKGMNAIYFLTLNIQGDGRDVWPYVDHHDFTRFDVSKLAQWEQVFEHMQQRGIALHLVTQETENERLLDDGDTGPLRKLYYLELIARFGHHLALIWNLGEENGYAEWSPPPQNDAQRKAMIDFFAANDPYSHPVVMHTHAEVTTRKPVLDPLLGYAELDGLSLQAHDREHAADVVRKWKQRSRESGHEWLVTMDEIGMWHTGADIDANDPGHLSLRGDVLWGTLLSGAAGVEWYFGAKVPHNDLGSEDWRKRDQLWSLTKNARDFFENYLPWWHMQPAPMLVNGTGTYAYAKRDHIYAAYFPHNTQVFELDLTGAEDQYEVLWYNPETGGQLQSGSITKVDGGTRIDLGVPPSRIDADWVVLVRK